MNIVVWLAFGLVAGVVAYFLDVKSSQSGLLQTAAVGIVGAVIGGLAANFLFGEQVTRFGIASFIVAAAATVILLFIYRALVTPFDRRI